MTKRNRAALGYMMKLAEQGFELEIDRILEDQGKEAIAIRVAADTYKTGTSYCRSLIKWHMSREQSRERKKKAAARHGH